MAVSHLQALSEDIQGKGLEQKANTAKQSGGAPEGKQWENRRHGTCRWNVQSTSEALTFVVEI